MIKIFDPIGVEQNFVMVFSINVESLGDFLIAEIFLAY